MNMIKRFLREEDGQDVVEYGLLIATIAIVVLLATPTFGDAIFTWLGTLSTAIENAGS